MQASASGTSRFCDVPLKTNNKMHVINRNQFLQSLVDHMTRRLCSSAPGNAEVIEWLKVLEPTSWPMDLQFVKGENEIVGLARRFNLDERLAVSEMREWIDSMEKENIPSDLTPLLTCVKTILCSSAECERDFSLMNVIVSDLRSSLLVKSTASLMMVSINGPPLSIWKPGKHVKSWLLHHRSATDTRSRVHKRQSHLDDERLAMWNLM
ncbi:KIAA1586 (predicted) [Pycnogonum litorale]